LGRASITSIFFISSVQGICREISLKSVSAIRVKILKSSLGFFLNSFWRRFLKTSNAPPGNNRQ